MSTLHQIVESYGILKLTIITICVVLKILRYNYIDTFTNIYKKITFETKAQCAEENQFIFDIRSLKILYCAKLFEY